MSGVKKALIDLGGAVPYFQNCNAKGNLSCQLCAIKFEILAPITDSLLPELKIQTRFLYYEVLNTSDLHISSCFSKSVIPYMTSLHADLLQVRTYHQTSNQAAGTAGINAFPCLSRQRLPSDLCLSSA